MGEPAADQRAISRSELALATEAADLVLARLAIDGYRFAVEPHAGGWAISLEFSSRGAWSEREIPIDRGELIASLDDEGLRERLVRALEDELGLSTPA